MNRAKTLLFEINKKLSLGIADEYLLAATKSYKVTLSSLENRKLTYLEENGVILIAKLLFMMGVISKAFYQKLVIGVVRISNQPQLPHVFYIHTEQDCYQITKLQIGDYLESNGSSIDGSISSYLDKLNEQELEKVVLEALLEYNINAFIDMEFFDGKMTSERSLILLGKMHLLNLKGYLDPDLELVQLKLKGKLLK